MKTTQETRMRRTIKRFRSKRKNRFILNALVLHGAPAMLVKFVMTLMASTDPAPLIGFLETFAGKKEVTRALQRKFPKRPAVALDITYDRKACDYVSAYGYAISWWLLLSVTMGFISAPVCSSFTWINRGTSKRSMAFPLGDRTVSSVVLGNTIVSNLMLQLWLLSNIGVIWILEQPARSLMEEHPRFQLVLTAFPVYKLHVWMSDFNAPTAKPSWLYSNSPYIAELLNFRVRDSKGYVRCQKKCVVKKKRRADGSMSVSGGPDLKATQAYTREFGQAVSMWYASRMQSHSRMRAKIAAKVNKAVLEGKVDLSKAMREDGDCWSDSSLKGAMEVLQRP